MPKEKGYQPQPPLRYDLVGSTQDLARERVQAGGDYAGVVITALRSSASRGRQGRIWHVPPGANVCLTTILPPVPQGEAWKIGLLAGVAVAEAINHVLPTANARLRFPNDVQIGGRKVGGILVESVPEPGRKAHGNGRVVPLLGIGVNVQNAPLPDEIALRASSLEKETGICPAVEAIENALLLRLAAWWAQWHRNGFAPVIAAWQSISDPGATRTFVLNGVPVLCRVCAIDPSGEVTLESVTDKAQHTLPAAAVILGVD